MCECDFEYRDIRQLVCSNVCKRERLLMNYRKNHPKKREYMKVDGVNLRIKAVMKDKGVSVGSLAISCDWDLKRLSSAINSPNKIKVYELIRIAKELKCSIEDLVNY